MRLPAPASVFVASALAASLAPYIATAEPVDRQLATETAGVAWYDAKLLTIEGQGWTGDALAAPFDRLPAKAEGKVRDAVWGLSRDSAGICVRFATGSPAVYCRWSLNDANLAMPHMPATGVSGVDLYVKAASGWRWAAIGRPTSQNNEVQLVGGLTDEPREYCLYLPLYNGVRSIEIGVSPESTIAPLPRPEGKSRPAVFWGTSITQGGCASRPGMVHTAILGRELAMPVINLGFSGNGKLEPEVAELMAEIDAAVYVIDCLPNCTAAEVTERIGPVVAILRKAHTTTPIVLVEDRTYADAFLVHERRARNESSRSALRAEFDRLVAAGDKHLHSIAGETLLGSDGEDTVDGSHPTDLGFLRHAEAMESVLAPLLRKP